MPPGGQNSAAVDIGGPQCVFPQRASARAHYKAYATRSHAVRADGGTGLLCTS